MPHGHIRQYIELVEEAQRKRIQITRQQQQNIARLYRDIAKDAGKEIAKKNDKTLTYRWLKDYAKSLKRQSTHLYSELQGIVGNGMLMAAQSVIDAECSFWGNIVPELSGRFRDTMSTIPQTCVDELMNGGIYRDFTGLSERLWNYKGKYDRDIGYIINRGIIEQKSAYDLAKDLEMYLDPRAEKPWEWRKVYPGCSQVVDYNAQRLSRTSITHAYQMSFQRSTEGNPFIEKYQWHSSNAGKTCELCRLRNTKSFDKDKLPLDHPNGMCYITAVINKTLDEIAEELNEWANGKENPALDDWLNVGKPKSGYSKVSHMFRKDGKRRYAKEYEHRSGTKFLYPNRYDKALQRITADKAMTVYDKVPEELARHIKTIEFADYYNPDDTYWERQYGIEGFSSYATGGKGRITFYANADEVNSNTQLLETYLHEGAHIWDNVIKDKTGTRLSLTDAYKRAMEMDARYSGQTWVSEYAEASGSAAEDFADFITGYYMDNAYYESMYPNRCKLYRRYLDADEGTY